MLVRFLNAPLTAIFSQENGTLVLSSPYFLLILSLMEKASLKSLLKFLKPIFLKVIYCLCTILKTHRSSLRFLSQEF